MAVYAAPELFLWHSFGGTLGGPDLQITCATNTFNGQWTVDQGTLVGVGANSLRYEQHYCRYEWPDGSGRDVV